MVPAFSWVMGLGTLVSISSSIPLTPRHPYTSHGEEPALPIITPFKPALPGPPVLFPHCGLAGTVRLLLLLHSPLPFPFSSHRPLPGPASVRCLNCTSTVCILSSARAVGKLEGDGARGSLQSRFGKGAGPLRESNALPCGAGALRGTLEGAAD